ARVPCIDLGQVRRSSEEESLGSPWKGGLRVLSAVQQSSPQAARMQVAQRGPLQPRFPGQSPALVDQENIAPITNICPFSGDA
ncbi:unnamed protein product, partial [Polarella glacialis]